MILNFPTKEELLILQLEKAGVYDLKYKSRKTKEHGKLFFATARIGSPDYCIIRADNKTLEETLTGLLRCVEIAKKDIEEHNKLGK